MYFDVFFNYFCPNSATKHARTHTHTNTQSSNMVKQALEKVLEPLEFSKDQITALFSQSESENPIEVVWLAVAKYIAASEFSGYSVAPYVFRMNETKMISKPSIAKWAGASTVLGCQLKGQNWFSWGCRARDWLDVFQKESHHGRIALRSGANRLKAATWTSLPTVKNRKWPDEAFRYLLNLTWRGKQFYEVGDEAQCSPECKAWGNTLRGQADLGIMLSDHFPTCKSGTGGTTQLHNTVRNALYTIGRKAGVTVTRENVGLLSHCGSSQRPGDVVAWGWSGEGTFLAIDIQVSNPHIVRGGG